MELSIRKSVPGDLPRMREIIGIARRYMRATGNMTQWGDSEGIEQLVEADIPAGNSYVVTEGERICATFAFIIGEDPCYRKIDGAWPEGDDPYGAIHRVASDGTVRNITGLIFAYCTERIPRLRIDTHADNAPMRAAVERAGFRYCGIILAPDGTERVAYERWVK